MYTTIMSIYSARRARVSSASSFALVMTGVVGLLWGSSVYAAEPGATSPAAKPDAVDVPESNSSPFWNPIWDFGANTVRDTGAILSSPVRWDARDWTWAGIAGAGVVGSIIFLDEPIQRYSQAHRDHGTDTVAKYANPFGTVTSFGVLAVFGTVGLATGSGTAQHVAVDGLEASIIASGIITPLLKFSFGRSRPDTGAGAHDFHPFSGGASFPSGHATQAFAVASVIAASYDDHPWVACIAFAGASLVGFARINDNKHWFSDVLMGGIIGTAVGYEVVTLDRSRQRAVRITPIIDRSTLGVALAWDF